MSDRGMQSIRRSVKGADQGLRLIQGSGTGPTEPPDNTREPWPIVALGHLDGTFHFLDARGQKRSLTARQLHSRGDLLSIFGGDDTWLREQFPKKVATESKNAAGEDTIVWRTVDFKINDAAALLQRACFAAGLFGENMRIRQPGIWRDRGGRPVVHCGDQVLIEGHWRPAGERQGNQIWAAAPAAPRPDIPCGADVGRYIQQELTALWHFGEVGAAVALVGIICNAFYGAALDWRPAAFVTGETGSGKSALQTTICAALPLHHYDNDTTKAGIEQAVHGRAMPIIIDEATDRANRNVSRELADLVLSAASGEGTRGSRGTVDGKGRRIEVAGLIVMFSINPPDLEPQHLGRMVRIELRRPVDGTDNRQQHRALAEYARAHGPSLWGRALAGWDRYQEALGQFRVGLQGASCPPREMDQAGALLAGWWLLTEEGVPDKRDVQAGISALHGGELDGPGLIRGAAEIEADSRPRRMLQHLMASMITLRRSTEREPIGKLIEIGMGESDPIRAPDDARQVLLDHGIRVVLKCEAADAPQPIGGCRCIRCFAAGRPVPRISGEAGAWFSATNPELKRQFSGTPFEGERWRHEMLRLPSAHRSGRNIRIGAVSGYAIWLAQYDLLVPDDGG